MAPVLPGFDPRPEIRRDNTTLTILIVGLNNVHYQNKVNDPLFNATLPMERTGRDNEGGEPVITMYYPTRHGRALACQEQVSQDIAIYEYFSNRNKYQFCYKLPSGKDECTELGELPLSVFLGNLPPPPNIDFSAFPNANGIQKTILRLITSSAYAFNVGTVAQDLMAQSLENPDDVRGLPNDQWLRELSRWQKQVLASLQVAVIDYSLGPSLRDTAYPVHFRPDGDSDKRLCGMQKMRKSGNVVNINVFGLSFIIAFSVLVALLDIFILKFMIYLSKFRAALGPRIDRWIQDGIWQLQRRAYEGEGYRGWTDLEADIPITKEDQLKDLPILWLPSKSPNMNHVQTFGSLTTVGSQEPPRKNTTTDSVQSVDGNEGEDRNNENTRGVAIIGWFKRRDDRD